MKGAIVHGVLLSVMLVYGWVTWTRDKNVKPAVGEVVMWNRTADNIKTIEFATSDREVRIERRGQGAQAYWWGVEKRVSKKLKPTPPPPPSPTPEPPPPPPPPEYIEEIITREFPIGEVGEKLVTDFARMRAIRSLGVVKTDEQKKEYELVDTSKTVAIVFGDGAKTLVLGGRVYGGADRYVQDVDTNKGFIVLGSLITPLEGGEGSLRPTDLRSFDPKDAMEVEIAANGKSKTVHRIKAKRPGGDDKDPPEGPHAKPPKDDEMVETWGSGTTADTAAANFIDKIEKLRPSSFDTKVDAKTLSEIVGLTYRDKNGKVLGTFKVMKATAPEPTYYVLTERSRVPAPVASVSAERIVPDITTIFPQ